MTWEWTVLICFFGTLAAHLLSEKKRKRTFSDENEIEELTNKVQTHEAQIYSLQQDFEGVKKLADETKKLLNQENLRKGLRGL